MLILGFRLALLLVLCGEQLFKVGQLNFPLTLQCCPAKETVKYTPDSYQNVCLAVGPIAGCQCEVQGESVKGCQSAATYRTLVCTNVLNSNQVKSMQSDDWPEVNTSSMEL